MAASILLGLSHAAPSASATDKPMVVRDPGGPVDRIALAATLRRLRRLPDRVVETTPTTEPADHAVPTGDLPSGPTTTAATATSRRGSTVGAPEPEPGTVGNAPATTAPPASPVTAPSSTPPVRDPLVVRDWQPISGDEFQRFAGSRNFTAVDYVTPSLVHGTITSLDQSINVILVHRSATRRMRVSPAGRGREPVGSWAEAIDATAGVNANWYNPFDGPAVSGGRIYGGSDHGYTALFGFTTEGDLVADHHHKIHERVDPQVEEAVSGHPTLIHRGTATTDFGSDPTFTNRHPRSVIAVTSSVDVLILVTIDGRRRDAAGMTGAETARLLQRLGAHDAVMLDGGGSSAMWIAGKGIVNRPADPGRAVGNQIAVFGR